MTRGLYALRSFVVVIAMVHPAGCWGQSPQFEVASVRQIKPPAGRNNPCDLTSKPLNLAVRISGNRLTLRSTTLGGLILDAYNVRDDQFTGLPGWADCKDQYEIIANAAGEGTPTQDQVQLMLQALLTDRFQLKLHHETKNLPVYELTIAKSGLKLKPTPERTTGNHIDQWGIVRMLIEGYLDYPIVDKTGLTGFISGDGPKWDEAKLREELQEGRPANLQPGMRFRSLAPSIFHDVETEFGLSLKKVSPPTDFLVIEHVERPSEN
jgi:uncharacterized protein (TIGR03435 family)